MDTQFSILNKQVLSHFIKQGQGIGKLHDILNSNILVHHVQKWISIILEAGLYVLFILLLFLATWMPSGLSLAYLNEQRVRFSVSYSNDEISTLFFLLSVIILFSSVPVLLFAMLLGRNRKKNDLIRQALTEVNKMKKEFDETLTNLNFS